MRQCHSIDHSRVIRFASHLVLSVTCAFLTVLFCQPLAAQEIAEPVDSTGSDVLPSGQYITSLLVDHEIPLIGGSWGSDLFIDFPLTDDPDDAAVTLRRAKLKYSHGFGKSWQLKLSGDYSRNGGLELSDSYLVYTGWKTARLTFGVTDPPFSLESVSSSAGLTFMERALAVNALSERKGGGIHFLRRTPSSILNAALVLVSPSRDGLQESGQAIVLHYVHSPIEIQNVDNIHLGGSFSYRVNADEDNTQFRSRPEIGTTNTFFVDTGPISNADRIVRAGLEASRVKGRYSWQTELLATEVQRNGFNDVLFWGAYAYFSWFLSNDSRNYDAGTGQYGALSPSSPMFKGGRGAFELAFRASYVDLSDKGVIGGQESNLSLGFNWYLNDKLRLMSNVVKVIDYNHPGSEHDGENPLFFVLRAQWIIK